MGVKCVQCVCVSLGVLGFTAALITCALPSWTVNYTMEDYRRVEVHIGLWMVCFYKSISEYQCLSYVFMNSYTEVACGLTVTCCIITAISLLLLLSACGKNQDADPKRRWAAVGVAVSGLLLIIPVSLTASDTASYRLDGRQLGVCMYTGWVGGALLLAGGTLCCCGCRRATGSRDTAGHRADDSLVLRATT